MHLIEVHKAYNISNIIPKIHTYGDFPGSTVDKKMLIQLYHPLQGTQVRSLIGKDFTGCGTTKVLESQLLSPCSRACELQLLRLCTRTTEAHTP